ncbi:nucleoside hydrolase [Vibrio vulnificus]|uniref:nucleoside hydrolase n=1 Tax=Vibrio vulnificus TaxID=672 RepID=UPI00102917D7|nr:nucleoside hydrolase [Vibrio vulnificus]RZP72268.1 nucleoside hydrolase [Vibrio vulnificus]RZP73094.1 nucleoside hydrolase [Vibrio vulnificus]
MSDGKNNTCFSASRKKVWVDTDITIGHLNGLKPCDVDDGYALGLLFRSKEVEIVGLSSTLGNTDDIDVSTHIAAQFVSKFGPARLAVSKGSDAFYEQAKDKALPKAVTDMAELLKQDTFSILAIGALTNIALLIKHYPELIPNIEELVCVAGRGSKKQNFIASKRQPRPFRDLNFEAGEAAFRMLLSSNANTTLIPFEVCDEIWVDFQELKEMKHGSPLIAFLEKHSVIWAIEWAVLFGSKEGFIPFDMVAAAYMLNSGWFTTKSWRAQIQSGVSDTDKQVNKNYLVCNDKINKGKELRYATSLASGTQSEIFKRLFMRGS